MAACDIRRRNRRNGRCLGESRVKRCMVVSVEREAEDIEIVVAMLALAEPRADDRGGDASCSSTQRLATFESETLCLRAMSAAARRIA